MSTYDDSNGTLQSRNPQPHMSSRFLLASQKDSLMRTALIRLIAISGLFAAWQANAAPSPENFVLPNHGTLVLSVPSDWKANVKTPGGDSPQTISFAPKNGAAFKVLLTPIWAEATRQLPDDAKVRSVVWSAAEGAEGGAGFNAVAVSDIVGPTSHGYFFSATDKKSAAGAWKYVQQGTVKTGDILVTFTILSNDGQQANAKTALEMIRHASHLQGDSVLAASR
jgi:hypothetical protein